MMNKLPDWGIGLLVAALLSAVMSTGSTTLMTTSTIVSDTISKGLEKSSSLRNTKIVMLVTGLLSILLSLSVHSIIQSLLLALTIFSGSFIIPTIAGLLGFTASKRWSSAAMITGGSVALAGKIISLNMNAVFGNTLIIIGFVLNGFILLRGIRSKNN